MTTAQDLIEETKRLIYASSREQVNRLTSTINSSVTSLAIDFPAGGIVAGAVLSIDTELMYVWAVSGSNVTVQRGYLGSTAASHTTQAMIFVNPRYSPFAIFQAINYELQDFSSPSVGLYAVGTYDTTASNSVLSLDVNLPGFISVIDVQYRESTSTLFWRRVDNYRILTQALSTDFPHAQAIQFPDSIQVNAAPIRIRYKKTFTALSATTDDVNAVSGLPTTCNDIIPMGAAVRLTMPRAIKRGFDDAQGESRRAGEVPPNSEIDAAQGLYALRNRRIAAEVARLNALYPTRLTN